MAVVFTNRRVNSTGRSRIPRAAVHARITGDSGDVRLTFGLDLSGLPKMPPHAKVWLDVYRRGGLEQFSLGTVGDLRRLDDEPLRRFGDSMGILLRIRIVSTDEGDEGRLLAFGDQLRPTLPKEDEAARRPILPFRGNDSLGQEIWRLEVNVEGPVVMMNSGLPSWNTTARSPHFVMFVYPEIMRQVGRWVAMARRDGETVDSAGDALADWMRFVESLDVDLLEVDADSDEEDLVRFADRCAAQFSNRIRSLEKFREMVEVSE